MASGDEVKQFAGRISQQVVEMKKKKKILAVFVFYYSFSFLLNLQPGTLSGLCLEIQFGSLCW